MARIGLSNIWFSTLTEATDGTATYEGASNLGKAVSAQISLNTNSAKLYGDDALAESDSSFSSGTITLGVTEDDDTVFAPLLGHTIDAQGEVEYNITDTAPYVGCGRIVTKMVDGEYKYKVEFLKKVKFKDSGSDETTKGESIEFGTPSVEGDIMALKDGSWKQTKTFTTLSDAVIYLKGLMAAPSL